MDHMQHLSSLHPEVIYRHQKTVVRLQWVKGLLLLTFVLYVLFSVLMRSVS